MPLLLDLHSFFIDDSPEASAERRGTAQRLDILHHPGGMDRHHKAVPLLATVKTRGANAISRLTFQVDQSIRANPS
jgi:hypothetical protein